MRTAIIVLGLALIAAVAVIAVWFRLHGPKRAPTGIGFREWIRDPSAPQRSAELSARMSKVAAQLAQEPPEVLVRMLLDNETVGVVKQAVCQAGTAIVPHLIAAIGDPAFRKPVDERTRDCMHVTLRRTEPLTTVLECLEYYAPAAAVAHVAPLVEDKNQEIRKHAALVLGTIGSDEAVASLCRSLSDDDAYVRSYAMTGILRALNAGRGSREFRSAMFEAIIPLASRHDETVSADAPRCLLRLDRERAISRLTTAETLAPGREGLQYVLRALREEKVVPEPDRLLSLIASLESGSLDYPDDHALGEALQLLAVSASEKAEAVIARSLHSPSQRVREDAAHALAASKGLREPCRRALDELDQKGWGGLTEAQRHVLAARILIDQVNNGGFAQYFVNSSGNQWPMALAGLQAMGAHQDASLVQKAVDFFGPHGPSTDRDMRHRQLAKLVKDNDDVFSPLEKVFYENKDDREVLLMRYITEHEADFR